jgi:phosphatidylserine decarboxylase
MVRDGYFYALAMALVAILLGWLTIPAIALIPVLLGCFFLWFFRDPERKIPDAPGAIVSPADGKVTSVGLVNIEGRPWNRISIFLNVFNVHVNRTPISGAIRNVEYRKGKFANAMGAASAEHNEQNIVTVEGEGQIVIFKQIAGLLARRIVFTKQVGDTVARGERIGLIKFGSRVDVLFAPEAAIHVKLGTVVEGGSSVLAVLPASTSGASTGTTQQQHAGPVSGGK